MMLIWKADDDDTDGRHIMIDGADRRHIMNDGADGRHNNE
jgi:hypothetical protein